MAINRTLLTLALLVVAGPALAHTGIGTTSEFASGFLHPIGGIDHVLAMVTVGLFAALLGGAARLAVPAAFVGMMLAAGVLGFVGVELPAVEFGISASVIVLGLVVVAGKSWPVGAAMALVAVFAIFHGFAHGSEIPSAAGAIAYTVGFISATVLLHAAGVTLGLAASGNRSIVRLVGAAVAIAGVAMTVS